VRRRRNALARVLQQALHGETRAAEAGGLIAVLERVVPGGGAPRGVLARPGYAKAVATLALGRRRSVRSRVVSARRHGRGSPKSGSNGCRSDGHTVPGGGVVRSVRYAPIAATTQALGSADVVWP
jgi:hypothetical protein